MLFAWSILSAPKFGVPPSGGPAKPLLVVLCLALLAGCFPPPESKLDENKNPYFLEGKARVAARDYKGAIDAFEKALEVHPRSALAHFELGMLYEQHGDQTERDYTYAMYHYQEVLRLRPGGVYPHDNAKVRIASCKQEIVKAESLAPVYYAMERELNRLKQENQDLRAQMENSQSQTARLAQAVPTPAPAPVPQPVTPQRMAYAGSASPGPEVRAAAPTYRQHVVKPNETVASIARSHSVRLESILAANPTLNPRRLQPGQTIKIPAP
jgi:LysM repeat protein